MTQAAIILALTAGLFPIAADAEPKKGDGTAVLVIARSGGGFVDPASPLSQYQFTLAADGSWQLKAGRDAARKGKLAAGALDTWLKDIQAGGLDRLKSNPALGMPTRRSWKSP
jgi:hypothetical protein